LAAGFQQAVLEALSAKARAALRSTRAKTLVLAGGVAANGALREAFSKLARDEKIRLVMPRIQLCTDNAAMVACAGWFRLRAGARSPLSVSSDTGWIAGEELEGNAP
jgi:N6-L-threonylcarbamoyladenine synthase